MADFTETTGKEGQLYGRLHSTSGISGSLSGIGGLRGTLSAQESLRGTLSTPRIIVSGLKVDSTENWNAMPLLIAQEKTVYVYSDHLTDPNGEPVPAFKVGDGSSYLIDLPFSTDYVTSSDSIKAATTAEWNENPTLVSEEGVLYIYTDRSTTSGGYAIPGFKVGDGTTYLIDLPFSDADFTNHINNTVVHITAEERAFWNNKVTAYMGNTEQLVLSKVD